jgi:hypothetical protein
MPYNINHWISRCPYCVSQEVQIPGVFQTHDSQGAVAAPRSAMGLLSGPIFIRKEHILSDLIDIFKQSADRYFTCTIGLSIAYVILPGHGNRYSTCTIGLSIAYVILPGHGEIVLLHSLASNMPGLVLLLHK